MSSCQKNCVRRWICNVVERGVLELDLRIYERDMHFLPPQLFKSNTLVKLTLGTDLSLGELPSDVSLPSLKTLFIDLVHFEYNNDLCGVLLAGCPVLEELSVHHRGFKGNSLYISSPTVKRLSVKYKYYWNCIFDLQKPFYRDDYSHGTLDKYPQVNLESLVEAKLAIYPVKEIYWSRDVTHLFFGVRNVEILHLSPTSVHVIYSRCRYKLVVFNNLVKLYFGSEKKRCWKLLPYLLKHSPKLETLIIKDLNSEINDDVFMHLKKVKVLHILSYGGNARELNHLKSFLRKTEYLEVVQVDVVTEKDDGIIMETKGHLMMHLGVSIPSNCQIKVSHK